MKKLTLLMLLPQLVFSQFTEDFSSYLIDDWNGDTAVFVVDSLHRLQLNAPEVSAKASIWRASSAILYGEWKTDVTLDFNPSSSNFVQIHLNRDQEENGYFVRIGGTDDEVSLYKSTNGSTSKIIDGINDYVDTSFVNLHLKVIRDSIGNWQLITSLKDSIFTLQGQTFDDSHLFPQKFGIECVYTSTRSNKFFFDNIEVSGKAFLDTFPVPQKNDIVINEILFNPLDGGVDFVEIINRSDKKLNLKDLQIGNYFAGVPDNLKSITTDYFFMNPQEIFVLCNAKNTLLQYHPNANQNQIIELESMPAFNNNQGTAILVLDSLEIDQFSYDETMHFDLLSETKGVALERINTEVPTQQQSNWHSASEESGFATPTHRNSQKQANVFSQKVMTLSPKTFSPNNDGNKDLLTIQLQFLHSGYSGRIFVFDDQGRKVKNLLNNTLFGTKNTFYWDGVNDQGSKVAVGRYIVFLEATHLNKTSIHEKQTTVIKNSL